MDDKNLPLSKNNCFECTISLILIFVPTAYRDFGGLSSLTLEIQCHVLQLQGKELKKLLSWALRSSYTFRVEVCRKRRMEIQSESEGQPGVNL